MALNFELKGTLLANRYPDPAGTGSLILLVSAVPSIGLALDTTATDALITAFDAATAVDTHCQVDIIDGALLGVQNDMAVLLTDGASPTQAHVNNCNGRLIALADVIDVFKNGDGFSPGPVGVAIQAVIDAQAAVEAVRVNNVALAEEALPSNNAWLFSTDTSIVTSRGRLEAIFEIIRLHYKFTKGD